MGFSDRAIGKLKIKLKKKFANCVSQASIIPYVKQIDTLAGEFAAQTNYLYLDLSWQ